MIDHLMEPTVGAIRVSRPGVEAPGDLKTACEQFEGLMVGMILKESLRETFADPEGDSSAGLDSFREFCIEQVAVSLAESSSLGIADQLLEQFSGKGSVR